MSTAEEIQALRRKLESLKKRRDEIVANITEVQGRLAQVSPIVLKKNRRPARKRTKKQD